MATRVYQKGDRESGQVLMMTAISVVALCAVIGLAFDVGYLFDDRRRAQTAADAAALSGAEQLRRGSNSGIVTAAANNNGSTLNGFENGTNGTNVVINNPPTSGWHTGDANYVEAIVTRSRPTLFMSIVGSQSGTVRARAVAGVEPSPNCIYALDPTASPGLNVASSSDLLNAGCGIVVDSNAGNALNCGGGGASVTGTTITVTGSCNGCASCSAPTTATNVPGEPDPLATFPAPSFSNSCDFTNTQVNGVTTTLGPGVYCNGIKVRPSGNATFLPGTYVINGGGFTVNGHSTISGTGVTFYLTGTNKTYGGVSISGDTTGTLSAPTSGPMESMLFFQDRTITANVTNSITGGSTLNLEGTLYFPTEALTFSGGSVGTVNYTIIVAKTINITGNAMVNANLNSLQDGNPIRRVSLAE